jgi:hypothetical protein
VAIERIVIELVGVRVSKNGLSLGSLHEDRRLKTRE